MNSVGGYYELELRKGKEFHPDAIALNTGRNALELILKVKKYSKVYIPYYTCDVIIEPLKKTHTLYEFYNINKKLEPVFDYTLIKKNEGFLYTNYFGIKDAFLKTIAKKCNNLIIDNSQAFFAKPMAGIPAFYSCRKFFGVPDGAYLYLEDAANLDLPIDQSEGRCGHLLKRIEFGTEAGYNDYKANEKSFIGQPIKQMSKLTKALLRNIDYEFVQKKRKENFLSLHKDLSKYNELEIDITNEFVPLVYPLLKNIAGLRQKLIRNKIFVASYWPNVLEWTSNESIENEISSQLIPLPIDQRVGLEELTLIVKLLI